MKIAVVGTGYVGLVTGTCFAESGNDVICVDTDASKVERLKRGEIPIFEPGLEEMVKHNLREERLRFTTDIEEAAGRSLMIFIAVGTPPGEDGSADLQYVLRVARDIGRLITTFTVVVNKSTVPVGTGDKVRAVIAEELARRGVDVPFDIVSNPEFLKEGNAIDDFMKPDRVIVGCEEPRTAELMKELYAPFVRTEHPILIMDVHSSEMTKYAANAMLATNISFMNDVANLCELVGADIDMVRKGIGSDSRIGYSFLFPGRRLRRQLLPQGRPGALPDRARARAHARAAGGRRGGELPPEEGAAAEAPGGLRRRPAGAGRSRSGAWPSSRTPTTCARPRRSSSSRGCWRRAPRCAPTTRPRPTRRRRSSATGSPSASTATTRWPGADGLILVTEWNEFRHPDFERMKKLMKRPLVFDGRNIYDPERMRKLGFEYHSIGRGN